MSFFRRRRHRRGEISRSVVFLLFSNSLFLLLFLPTKILVSRPATRKKEESEKIVRARERWKDCVVFSFSFFFRKRRSRQ